MTRENSEPTSPANRFCESLWWAVAVNVFVLPNMVAGQTIDTNRPGFSFSPNVVGPGRVQLETGITYTRSDDDTRTTSLPVAEIRIGVANRIEVFVSSLSWSEMSSANSETSGLLDMALGAKVNINRAAGKTRMAILFQLSVPTGDDSFSSDRWDPGVAFVWAHNADLAFAGTVKVSESRSGYQLDNGLKMPFSWGDAHSGFVEWEMNLPQDGGSSHWLNGGYQWLIGDRTQIDFNAGLGLNDRAGDYRLGIGFSARL